MPRPPLCRLLVSFLVAAALLSGGPAFAQNEAGGTVDVIEVDGVIDPTVADYLKGRLAAAEDDGAHAAIVRLDTPGGLDVSMRDIIQKILDLRVPVIVWVAPRGARAASAGTFITYAANLAYMAEATEIGAATPVNLGGGEQSDTLRRKVTNDAVAYITEIARERGRNVEWAEEAVRNAASIGATEAARIGVVDGVTSSLRELLEAMDGKAVTTGDEDEVVLETWDEGVGTPSVAVRFQAMNLVQRLLHAVTNPEVAFLLLLAGAFGLIFEVYNPGIGLAGILGAISLLLGFYALSVLPTNWAGVFLIILGVVFFLVDLQAAGLGIWTVGGVVALVAGGSLLFSGADPSVELSPWAIAGAVAGTLLFFISVMTAALRVRLRRPITGEEAIVGMVGEAKTDIAPEGTVLTKGTLWRARTMETGIAAGSKVKVRATEGLVLLVEPLHEGEL
ncbi:MAG: nodulation protein NfeD [Actinomycetota bacterium]